MAASLTPVLFEALQRATSMDDLLCNVATIALQATGADACDILVGEPGDALALVASTHTPELNHRLKLGRGLGLSGRAVATGQPIYIRRHAQLSPDYVKYPGHDDDECESIAILPMLLPSGASFGVLMLKKTTEWPMRLPERRRLEQLTYDVALAYLGYRSAYEAGAMTSRLGALSEVSKTIATSPYLEEILQLLVNLTAQQFNYRVCTVRLLDESRGELVLRATQAPAKAYQRKRAIKLGESIAGRAIAENRAIIVRDVQIEDDYIGHDLAVEQGLRSMICVPLMFQERAVGVLSCYTSEVRDFGEGEINALETLAKQAAVSIEHAKMQVRDTLMQEMHHRVKNNLQQVASLLRLQVRHSQYKSLEEALNDTLARILAIASVHDLLSRDDLDHVGMGSVAESLVHHQQASLIMPGRQVRFEVRGDDVRLNMTQATQMALIINELILNAVEHGFKRTTEGEVHVTIEEKDEEISVWVSNSGDSLPADFDPVIASHLGLQIVENLARSLGGKFKLHNVLGWTVAEVKFPRATGE